MRETAFRYARKEKLPEYPRVGEQFKFTVTFIRFETGLHEYYRAAIPGVKLRSYGLCNTILPDEGTIPDRAAESEVLVISRPNAEAEYEAIRQAREQGKVIIIDTDDYVHLLPTLGPPLENLWPIEKVNWFEACVREADAVSVSVVPLAERMMELGARAAFVLDNSLDPRSRRWEVDWPPDDGRVRIGWMAGFTHGKDAALVEGAIKRVLKEYPQAIFKTVGYMPPWVVDLDPDQFEVGRTVGMLDFAEGLVGIDIALGPLEYNAFNEYRSSVKAWEAICAGCCFVASNYGPYKRDLRHGRSAFLCDTEDEWVEALSRLVESAKEREYLWWDAYKDLMFKHSIDWTVPAFYQSYKDAFTGSPHYQMWENRMKGTQLWTPR